MPETTGDVLARVFDDEPFCAFGDGETFEDMISTTLAEHDPTLCPKCGTVMHVSEESLGQLALSMISQM
jgi:hypothetical protein